MHETRTERFAFQIYARFYCIQRLVYNHYVMLKAAFTTALAAVICLAACNKNPNPSSNTATKSNDAVQQKLVSLAGNSAKDCGRLKTQDPGPYQTAGDCALQAAKAKQPFYVAYELPGLVVGVAGNAEGKLFSVQGQQGEGQNAGVTDSPCPAELRLAQSGRVTCFTAGSMGGMGMGEGNPHGGAMTMPPATGSSPHGGMGTPPAGTPNPHAGTATSPSHPKQ